MIVGACQRNYGSVKSDDIIKQNYIDGDDDGGGGGSTFKNGNHPECFMGNYTLLVIFKTYLCVVAAVLKNLLLKKMKDFICKSHLFLRQSKLSPVELSPLMFSVHYSTQLRDTSPSASSLYLPATF